jgi:hypothetical protein
MKVSSTEHEPPSTNGLPEFLAALDRAYRLIGLTAEDARAATFADAEIFAGVLAAPEVAV